MPELPEVEVIVRGLRKNIQGLKILEFRVINKNLRYKITDKMKSLYKNKTIKHIFRVGKYGIFLFDGKDHLAFHLGMTGKFRFCKKKSNDEKHDHIAIRFNKNVILKYNDVRKFGYFFVVSNPICLNNFKNLGIEPFYLEQSKNYLWENIKKKK